MAEKSLRRRPGQLRADIVRAASKLFLERGFDGTSMRDIAAATGTSQSMLYRHFPSKAALFETTVLAPFREFMLEFVRDMRTHSASDLPNEELFARFNAALYDLTLRNRQMFLALLSADAFAAEVVGGIADALTTGIPDVVDQLKVDRQARGWDGLDLDVVAREVIAMVIGTALLDPFLFGAGSSRPSRSRILAGLTRLEVSGSSPRTSPSSS